MGWSYVQEKKDYQVGLMIFHWLFDVVHFLKHLFDVPLVSFSLFGGYRGL
jgi:hypothetical protein